MAFPDPSGAHEETNRVRVCSVTRTVSRYHFPIGKILLKARASTGLFAFLSLFQPDIVMPIAPRPVHLAKPAHRFIYEGGRQKREAGAI
jgi:hypothetical protein